MPPHQQSRDPETHPGAQLGAQLRAVRKAKGFTSQEAIAEKLGTDRSVATKAETGEIPPTAAVLKMWLDVCEVSGLHRDAVEGLWKIARAKQDPGRTRTAPWFETEAKAHTLRYWSPVIIPGMVQTAEYARALFSVMGLDDARIAEFVEIRMGRQSILGRPEPPDITIVLWEPMLANLIGSPAVMRDQLARLLELCGHPQIHIHVLPASIGANAGLGGAINLAATTDAPELLLSDGLVEDVVTADPALVRRASSTFNNVRSDALPRAASRALISEAMETWTHQLATGGSPVIQATAGPTA